MLKKLFVIVISLLFVEASLVASAQGYCAALSGQWYGGVLATGNTGPNGTPYFDLQDVAPTSNTPQAITGTYNFSSECAGAKVNGTMNTNGTFAFTIGPYPQPPGCGGGMTESATGSFAGGYNCAEVVVVFESGGGDTAFHRTSCPVPNSKGGPVTGGEGQTTFVIWGPPAPPANGSLGVAEFQATIKPPLNIVTGKPYTYFNWGGRAPMETFSEFDNTCQPTPIGEPIPDADPFGIVNGNEIYDQLGWKTPATPNSVRTSDSVPCMLTWQQTMSIDCDAVYGNGPAVAYEKHPMLFQVNASTISVQRNSVNPNPVDQPFGTPQAGIRTAVVVAALSNVF